MARIPESEIERIKREVSLERLVEASGIELKKTGKDLFGKCPFHAPDDTPSLSITPAKNLWHCLGACGEGGDVFAWVMKRNGVSFRHAYELLREGLSSLAASPVKKTTVRALPPPVSFDADDQALRNQVALVYYAGELKRSPEALAYLKARGIDRPEAIDKFKLGYANRTLGLRLPNSQRVTGSKIRERLQRVGILRESGHEHFNGSLVVPIVDEAGNVVEMYGRKIVRALRSGTAKHLYLPEECRGASRGVWNWEALVASKEIILCEALIDALTFWCAGFRNVTSAYSAGVFTDEMLAAMKRHGTERVLIAFDRDEPGEKGAADVAERLIAAGIEAWRVEFPKGMDANEYALKVQPAVKSLGIAIRKALWLGKGKAPEASPTSAPIAGDVEVLAPAAPIDDEPRAIVSARAASSLAAELAANEKTEAEETSEPRAQASPVPPPASAPSDEPEVTEAEIALTYGDRTYRVRGLAKNASYEVLKVNLLAARGERFHVDTVDLRNSKQKHSYISQAALELELREDIVKDDLGKLFFKLEAMRDEAIERALAPKASPAVAVAEPECEAALALLRSPQLIERILADLEACGLVGERTNKLVAYLACTSRKLDAPLAVLVQSSSAAGKSTLMDAVLAMMPEEERLKYSAMTGQALFYGEDLKHKILAIVEEEGAARASYALKLLHSEGELTIASTGKDPVTGNLVTQPYRVEGPTMLFTTTTAAEIDPELQNRCLVLAVDESREQTQAIHRLQRDKRTLEGMARKAKKKELQRLHQNAQRLLKPLEVLNPYSDRLTFPDQATRMRRDHEKYLTLIDVIALVHQHQRELRITVRDGQPIEYVEATFADVALANELAHEVLGRSLDELPPQTRRVLEHVDRFVAARAKAQAIERAQVRFTRRELREATAIGDTQLKIHLGRLVELEYAITHRRGAACDYELLYDGGGQDGRPYVPGLIDVAALKATATTVDRSGENADRSAPGRGPVGPRSGGGRGAENAASARDESDSERSNEKTSKTHIKGGNGKNRVVPLAAAGAADDDDAAA